MEAIWLLAIKIVSCLLRQANHHIYVQHQGSQKQLKELFDQFGKVSEVTVPKNKATQSTKGFAFVLYENGISADRYGILEHFSLPMDFLSGALLGP